MHRGVFLSVGASHKMSAMFQTERDLQDVRVPDRVDQSATAMANSGAEGFNGSKSNVPVAHFALQRDSR